MERLPTIAEAHQLIRGGQLTPLELVEHCLARIEQFDERIQAWVHVECRRRP
jgi:Asp-tRNA(Asn)/Glu-tRNA(Gln) amidotransferase A subunit family amidase